jgi:hypothetical protein
MTTPLRPLLLTLLLAACAAPDRALAPEHPRLAKASAADADARRTRRRLERAADGLLYTSESDYPFTYVSRSAGPPAADRVAAFRAAFAVPPAAPVQVVSLDDFFTRHIERVDPADSVALALVPRYVRLRETLRASARDVRVYRVGTIAIDCYAVGTDASGNWVGLQTVAIET